MHFIKLIECSYWILLFASLNSDICLALRDVRVQIPHAVRKGEKAILKCLYDLEGDSLYSVKWYKGRREFYSFTPKETPAMKVFQFAGVKVDRSSSNESQLVLETVNAATSGKYSCEVSADAPSFHTLIGAGELEVVVPGKDPVITGIRSRYKIGDIVRGNCTSSHSRPAANITWTVNGYETNPAHVRHFRPHKDPRELETVISAIHFVVTPQHFIYGKLKIRCTAFIHDVYWKSTEKSIEENRLNKEGTSNMVHKFSEDYFDLEEDNVVDRSDTYMTHIKGDVSSLNASGCSAFHKCSCFWPRLTTLSLIIYAVQQMLQLLQQFLTQTTSKTTITTITATTTKETQNSSNCKTMKVSKNNDEENKNLLKLTKTTVKTLTSKEEVEVALKQQTSGSLTTQVATICFKNKQQQQQQQQRQILEENIYWPKDKHFEIEPIMKKQKQFLYRLKPKHHNNCIQQQQKQKLWHLYFYYIQPVCDKTLYAVYNLTLATATQVPDNIVTLKHISTCPDFNFQQFLCHRNKSFHFTTSIATTTSHNLNAVFIATTTTTINAAKQSYNFVLNSLNAATWFNTCCTYAGNLTTKNIFLISKTTATTITISMHIITITTT